MSRLLVRKWAFLGQHLNAKLCRWKTKLVNFRKIVKNIQYRLIVASFLRRFVKVEFDPLFVSPCCVKLFFYHAYYLISHYMNRVCEMFDCFFVNVFRNIEFLLALHRSRWPWSRSFAKGFSTIWYHGV